MNDTYIVTLYLFGVSVLAVFAIGFTLLVSLQKQKQARHKLEKKELEFQYQSEILQTRLEVQEQSMTLISEEIHDNVGQLLSTVQMHLHAIARQVTNEDASDLIAHSKENIGRAISELRHISHSLNTSSIQELGLMRSLEREIDFMSSLDLKCYFEVTGEAYSMTREEDLLIFRIIQEGIQNVLKHAQATSMTISFAFDPEQLTIKIADDGVGFDPLTLEKTGSLGLMNIRNRASLLNSQIIINSILGKGSILQLHIPKKQSHDYG